MVRQRTRTIVRNLANKLGSKGVAALYLGVASLVALSAAAISNPSHQLKSSSLSAADFSKIGGGFDETGRFLTPTFDEDFWSGGDMASDKHWRRSRRRARRSRALPPIRINLQPQRQQRKNPSAEVGYSEGTSRTVCVRMCDGYYWPVSFNGENGNSISKDANICRNSCAAPTRLFIDNNPGPDIDQMVDQSGRSYSKLKNAYRYRNEYVSDCKCKANPWEVASVNRHRYYALVNQAKKSRAVAKVVRKQKRKIAVAKRKLKKQRKKEWRRIAKTDGFWAKKGDTRYGLGAKEVPYTDDNGYPIEILSSRPRRKQKSKYVRKLNPRTQSLYIRSGNPFSSDNNFADPSTLLGKPEANLNRPTRRSRTARRRAQSGRMRLIPKQVKRKSRPARRKSSRPSWAREAFSGN